MMAPNFLSVRLNDDDKRNFTAVQDHIKRKVGAALPAADLYRLAMLALAEKYGLKVK
jgi:hypothetical protein